MATLIRLAVFLAIFATKISSVPITDDFDLSEPLGNLEVSLHVDPSDTPSDGEAAAKAAEEAAAVTAAEDAAAAKAAEEAAAVSRLATAEAQSIDAMRTDLGEASEGEVMADVGIAGAERAGTGAAAATRSGTAKCTVAEATKAAAGDMSVTDACLECLTPCQTKPEAEQSECGTACTVAVTLSPTCADVGTTSVPISACTGWAANHCGKSWADSACPKSCGVCQLCAFGEWGEWSACTSTCGGGGRYRTRGAGDCGAEYTESEQCGTDDCDAGPDCALAESAPLVVTTDGAVVENLSITTDGVEPAIFVYGASNVVLRNIKVVHAGHARVKGTGGVAGVGNVYLDQSGAGIYFQKANNISLENVHVSLVRPSPNPHATDGVCADRYCGPFPYDLKYAYNIYGTDSEGPRLSNVFVTGGSTGFWCKNCPRGTVSHYRAENLHGPFPRGQCFQVVSSERFTLEDFTCVQDNTLAFPEDDISVWDSPYSTVQRGLIQGGNAPNGVGVIFEMSDHGVCQDVDVTLVGGTCFSAYGADNVTFLRTRAKDNHGDGSCLDGQGYCKDPDGLWPNSQTYASDQTVPDKTCCGEEALTRCDVGGGVWFAGDYTSDQAGGAYSHKASNVQIKQGVFADMTRIEGHTESYSNAGHCVDVTMDDWATSAANRQEAYILKDFANEDFTLRTPFTPAFCFSTD